MSEVETVKDQRKNNAPLYSPQKSILIVEDDPTHQTLMKKILEECSFNTVVAENGVIALSKIDSGEKFDLIIMDWDMPELNGLETVRELRRREIKYDLKCIPVIAFTSNRAPGDREKCIAAGMNAYLPKDVWMPKWRDTLLHSLNELVLGNSAPQSFEDEVVEFSDVTPETEFDLDAFDLQMLEQSAALLRDELSIAVEEYLEDAASYIRDIKEGLEQGDAIKAARGSHPLKSNSKSFGLIALSEISEVINDLSMKGNLYAAQALLPQLQGAFCKAEKMLRKATKIMEY